MVGKFLGFGVFWDLHSQDKASIANYGDVEANRTVRGVC